MFELILNPEPVLAVRELSATDDIRTHLNGICFEIDATETRLLASNGHMIGAYRILRDEPLITSGHVEVIVPLPLLKLKKKGVVTIRIGDLPLVGTQSRPVYVEQVGVTVSGQSIDGRFPDWRRVIPAKEATGEVAQFNLDYIAAFGRAYKQLHPKAAYSRVNIAHNGERALAVVGFEGDENFWGGLMPMIGEAPSTPAWVR
jgi:DNA polymerase-3 subunit beta